MKLMSFVFKVFENIIVCIKIPYISNYKHCLNLSGLSNPIFSREFSRKKIKAVETKGKSQYIYYPKTFHGKKSIEMNF